MNKFYQYNQTEGMVAIMYPFSEFHLQALKQIELNDGYAEFENRDPNIHEDIDGNSLSWKICDELVEMGLLDEDEESFSIYFELNSYGKNFF